VRLCGRDQRRKMIPYTAQGQIPRVTKRNSVVEGRIGGKRNGVGGSAAAVVDGCSKNYPRMAIPHTLAARLTALAVTGWLWWVRLR